MPALLDVVRLEASYGTTKVLHGLDFALQEGSITALLGANWRGQDHDIARAVRHGQYPAAKCASTGARIDGCATEDIVRHGIAHVPDGRGTFLNLSTEDNLRLGAYSRRGTRSNKAAEGGAGHRAHVRLFPRALKERHRQQAGTLSGGEQQMLAGWRAR
ncbi:MAG: hypothetical protein WDN04_26460 [Rhodospirillales bacterium]